MANTDYHIFGIGLGTSDLRYIGWTQKSLSDEREQIVSELIADGDRLAADWIQTARHQGQIDIFEIESVPTKEDALDSTDFWGHYFHSLGLDVMTRHA